MYQNCPDRGKKLGCLSSKSYSLGVGGWEGILPGASAPTSVFPSHWPSGKALRWNTAGDYRRKLSACTRMVNAPEGIW